MTRALVIAIVLLTTSRVRAAGEIRVRSTPVPHAGSPCDDDKPARRSEGDRLREYRGYHLKLCVTAEFDTIDFNKPAYLDSMGELEGKLGSTGGDPRSVGATGVRRWLVTFDLDAEPAKTVVELQLAGRRWNVEVRGIAWRAVGGAHLADAMVSLSVPDPNWPVLHGARLLAADGPAASILEVVVENRSKVPVAIETVALTASTNAGFQCANGEPKEPIQTVVINWPRAVSHSDRAAWTTLGGTSVAAETSFRAANCGDYSHRFWIKFPVQDTLQPGQFTRLVYRIEEAHVDNDLGVRLPKTLRQWDSVSVSIKAGSAVLPQNVGVAR